jgi:hypothetical protein
MKKETITATALMTALSSIFFVSHAAFAANPVCSLNGQVVPCDQLGKQMSGFLGLGLLLFIVILGIGIWSLVFWVLMVVHAAKHPIEDKAMWIIILVFTGIIGAIAYYFAVKRTVEKQASIPPVQDVTHSGQASS